MIIAFVVAIVTLLMLLFTIALARAAASRRRCRHCGVEIRDDQSFALLKGGDFVHLECLSRLRPVGSSV